MEKREKHLEVHQAQLSRLEADVASLKELAKKTSGDVRTEYQDQVSHLERKLDTAREKVADLRRSSGDAWDEVRAVFEHSLTELRNDIARARKALSTK